MANRLHLPPLDNIGKKVRSGEVENKYFLITGEIVKHGSKGNARELGKSRLHSSKRRALSPAIIVTAALVLSIRNAPLATYST
jgi:hypothetical protein